jgi:Tfp pilus assembly PilM family ATPase
VAKRSQILGLDVGHAAVKAVLASSRGSRVVIARAETLRLPTGGTFDRAAIIGRWLREQGLAANRCVVAMSGQQAVFQPMFMVPGDPRTIEQAATMELIKMRDMAAEDMTHSFDSFASKPGERRVLLAMARPAVLDETMALVRQLGLELLDIVPAPVAVFNALVPGAERRDAVDVLVHVGHSITEFAVGSHAGLMFARAFAGGGQLFTDALARARQMPVPHAENMKVTGVCSLTKGEPADVQALTRAADTWVAEFQSCLAVFNSVFPQAQDRPTRLVLSGGGALLEGFAEYVRAKTGLETTVAARLAAEGTPAPVAPWAIAAGLVASALRAPACAISLVPRAIRDEWVFRKQKPFWIAAGLTAGLILAVGLLGGWYDSSRMERLLREQRASLERRRNLVAQIEGAKARNDQFREHAAPVADLLRAGPQMRQIMALVAAAKAPNDWITLFCDAGSYYAQRAAPSLARAMEGEGGERRRMPAPAAVTGASTNGVGRLEHIIVEGYTLKPNFSTVQKLLDRLEASELVASADLLSDDKLVKPAVHDDQADQKAKRFVIDIKVANR